LRPGLRVLWIGGEMDLEQGGRTVRLSRGELRPGRDDDDSGDRAHLGGRALPELDHAGGLLARLEEIAVGPVHEIGRRLSPDERFVDLRCLVRMTCVGERLGELELDLRILGILGAYGAEDGNRLRGLPIEEEDLRLPELL